ncbi:hypothetical protein FDA94_28535 [Herbidospora galbida]|uniref:Uncharacterized protein n=1 Tax=Herbidospora galbida TaxID=2575442 RepID=A0A4U3M8L0_9ACTN|nr:hypothetical protein [Herbidospora galbida]TKK84579.1 hypothetical protein FDA94_28535 [Herbidospora galbida]
MNVPTPLPAPSVDLALTDPRVLGPVAAFIFVAFVFEIIVSGRAYRRVVAERDAARAVVDQLLPLAAQMAKVLETNNTTLARVVTAVEDLLNDSPPRPKRRTI